MAKGTSRRRSFTLVELLVAIAISAIVIVGVQGAFAQAKQVWQRVEGRSPGQDRLSGIVDALRTELGGLYLPPTKDIKPFEFQRTETGEAKLAFFTTSPAWHGSEVWPRTVRVTYEHRIKLGESTPSALIRREQLCSGEKPIADPSAEVVATNLMTMSMEFYDASATVEQDRWRPEPSSDRVAAAVRLRLALVGGNTGAVQEEACELEAILVVPCQTTIKPPQQEEGEQ